MGREERISKIPLKVLPGINFDYLSAILLGKRAPFGVGQRVAKSDKGLRAQRGARKVYALMRLCSQQPENIPRYVYLG